MIRMFFAAVLCAALAGFAPALAANAAQDSMKADMKGGQSGSAAKTGQMTAEEFVKKAAIGGMFEVESSKVAMKQAQDPGVKDFAQELIDDHQKASDELKQIAKQENIDVPAKLDQEHQQKMSKLQDSKGDFRTAYLQAQVDAHQTAVDVFETYANSDDNGRLEQFAEKTLPVLRDHLEDVKALKAGAKMTN